MKQILGYIRQYIRDTNKRVFLLSSLFMLLGIFINYYLGLNQAIRRLPEGLQILSWLAVFTAVFAGAYGIEAFCLKKDYFTSGKFWFLLLAASAIFAWKMSYNVRLPHSAGIPDKEYWNQVLYWPFKLLVVSTLLYLIWKVFEGKGTVYGLEENRNGLRPYLLMLVVMVPLVALASTQPDFLRVYPKLMHMHIPAGGDTPGLYQLVFELSYGSDFLTIEFFFRGFLVLAFARFAGKGAILPMALFYCAIHFGKPLGECISSYFGGILLGIITYHTRSIWGGLIIHLGIAWLMELGGYLGRSAMEGWQ